MGELIQLDHYRNGPGNGALTLARQYFDDALELPADLHRGDQFLAWLWISGFKVVPLNETLKLETALQKISKLTNECSDPNGWLATNVRHAAAAARSSSARDTQEKT